MPGRKGDIGKVGQRGICARRCRGAVGWCSWTLTETALKPLLLLGTAWLAVMEKLAGRARGSRGTSGDTGFLSASPDVWRKAGNCCGAAGDGGCNRDYGTVLISTLRV